MKPLESRRATRSRPLIRLSALAAVAALACAASTGASPSGSAATPSLGTIDFPNSGRPEAQDAFLRGVLLLHSFEYEDAREAFQEARKADPDFVMAAWGEAMTHNHPLWMERDREAARAALDRLAPTAAERAAKAPTRRERDFLAAVEVLYADGEKAERDAAYAETMRRMAEAFPDDLEVRSFHALSILGTAEGRRDYGIYMRAGAEAEEVYRVNPEHPGALHYLIHSYDDPVHAPLGLRAARVYARVAPAASHAQHMISHIYVALGRWDETVDANEKAFAVSEERARRKGLPLHRRSHHALHWLQYAYLQQGRFDKARRMLALMNDDARAAGSKENLGYHAAMRAGWLVETGRGKDLPEAMTTEGVTVSSVAASAFTEGARALAAGDRAGAESALAEMRRRSRAAGEAGAAPHCGTTAYGMNSRADLDAADVIGKELEALIAWDSGGRDDAIRLLREAVALEEAMPSEYGPPIVVKPSSELLGEKLLALGRNEEALSAFESSLARAPRRSLSLLGAARAAARAGRTAEAAESWATLAEIWRMADPDLPELAEVKEHAAAGVRAGR